jgi:3-deoxy-7-phosphoheptulonate synthase
MIIMKKDATEQETQNVIDEIKGLGLRADVSRGESLTIIGLVGDERRVNFQHFAVLPGVKEARPIETPYKLISREYSKSFQNKNESRVIRLKDVQIGGDKPVYIAGPCAIESKQQLFRIAEEVKKAGAQILRGGIFKPRSSAHSWQGLGSQGDEDAREEIRNADRDRGTR